MGFHDPVRVCDECAAVLAGREAPGRRGGGGGGMVVGSDGEASDLVYSHDTKEVSLDDFTLLAVIGKGSFGKVACQVGVVWGMGYGVKNLGAGLE